jgi:hypothetical protein
MAKPGYDSAHIISGHSPRNCFSSLTLRLFPPIIPAMKRIVALTVLIAALVLAVFARDFAMPRLVPATAMAIRDSHPNEKLTLGADPYDIPAKASLFHAKLLEHSVLPILVVFTNDGDQTVVLTNARFELVTRDRAKASPYSLDDLRRALTAISAPRSRSQDQLPLPLPGKNKAHGGLSQNDRDELDHAAFSAHAVEPHASQQGFLFFDVGDLDNPAQGARLFVTGVNDAHNHELMYFEVELQASTPATPKRSIF